MNVETVPIGSLVLDPANARIHSKRNLSAIAESLDRFGQRRALVVMHDGTVIAGNGTLVAAKSLGWSEIAVSRVPEDWTAEQAKAYALADNRTAELADWDLEQLELNLAELDAAGWDMVGLGFDGLPYGETAAALDEVPELGATAIAEPGDLWILGEHRLACGSATDAAVVGRALGDRSVALVVTDPPYGVDYTGKTKRALKIQSDALADDDLFVLVRDALSLALASSIVGGPIYVFHPDTGRVIFEAALRSAGWEMKQVLVWIKDIFVMGRQDYHWQHEPVLYGWKPGGRHRWFGARKRSTIVSDEGPDLASLDLEQALALLAELYGATDAVRHPRPARSEDHPTMKPVALLERLLLNSSRKGDLVYDPFLGSGSTLIAAEDSGRVCAGVELDPLYVDVVVRRWEKLTGGKAECVKAEE